MRLSLLLACLFPSLAFAGLVEVNSSQYLRESGNPQAQYLEVTLDNAGEIRVSNVNLQDGYIELAASTDVLLNGSSLMQPFSLPTGGSAVFPLEAGTHYLEVTLRGKPGGGLKVAFYEDKPDAPEKGTGFEILNDGTLLHKKTGLIWHRKPSSPGLEFLDQTSQNWTQESIEDYVNNLNSGVYGESFVTGNANQSDWRVPTVEELFSLLDFRFGDGCRFAFDDEGEVCLDYYRLSNTNGDGPYNVYGEPFFLDLGYDTLSRPFRNCRYISSTLEKRNLLEGDFAPFTVYFDGSPEIQLSGNASGNATGCVWPVRGGAPE